MPHQGKLTIQVRRDDFGKARRRTPGWKSGRSSVRGSEKVIGPESHALIVSDFSTTGPTERAASEVVLMDCVQSYFSYRCDTLCGIPKITLEGTAEDWEKIHQRVNDWSSTTSSGGPTTCCKSPTSSSLRRKGSPNPAFWKAIYKQEDDSGGPYTTGWLVRLAPVFEAT